MLSGNCATAGCSERTSRIPQSPRRPPKRVRGPSGVIESSSSDTDEQPELLAQDSPAKSARPPHHMSTRNRWLFFITAWLIVLMPFLFWWNTWFGRQLSDKQITAYLQDEKHPRHIRHGLPRDAVEDARRLFRHGARKRCAFAGSLWRRRRPPADHRAFAARPN